MRLGERLGVRRTKRTQEETDAWVGSMLEKAAESSSVDDPDSVMPESRPVEWTHPPPEFDNRRRRKQQSSVHNEEGRGIGDEGCALLVSEQYHGMNKCCRL